MSEQEIASKLPAIIERSKAVKVVDQASMSEANTFLIAIKQMKAKVSADFDPIIKAAHEAHKTALEKKNKYFVVLDAAERDIKGEIGRFLEEENRKIREAERKAREAEEERLRVEREAERRAQEAAQKAKEAEDRAARLQSDEGRRLAQEEVDALWRQKEDYARLEASRRQAAAVKSVAPATVLRVETLGISSSETWDYEVYDENAIPREFLLVNEVKLRKYAKTMKDKGMIPGVRFFPRTIVSQRI